MNLPHNINVSAGPLGSSKRLRFLLLPLAAIILTALVSSVGTSQVEASDPDLLGYYSFDDDTANDSSGAGNNGILNGDATFADSQAGFGRALSLDGLGDFVQLPSTSAMGLYNDDFTVSAWFKSDCWCQYNGSYPDSAILGNDGPLSGSGGLHLVMRNGNPYMGFFGNDIGSGTHLSLDTWHHVTWRYTKATGEQAIFLNGALISSGGGHGAFIGTGNTLIGRCCQGWDQPRSFDGLIDEVRIYGRALNNAEVSTLTAPPAPDIPASCTEILLDGDSTGNGIYTIDPEQDSSTVDVYCDMTTDGGGWTLVGYGANANLAGKLNTANGSYDPTNRAGSANINGLALAQMSTEVSLSWSNGAANGPLTSYAEAVGYEIPNPAGQTLDPYPGGYQCLSSHWSAVTVTPLVGSPNLPSLMYTRATSLGAVYGLAYGLSRSNGNPQCDWTIDGQAFRAVYLGINVPTYARGVVYEPGGSGNHVIPATMAIWFRGGVPQQIDTDGDGVPDAQDAFPNDPSETTDTDGDGVGDNGDAFPNDASETTDTDGDGVGDNGDAFPNDPSETTDTDGDGVGDNGDAFPNDPSETTDTDGDGVGDNGDAFPNDPSETTDTDGDGVGDNSDAFPTDPSETTDTDGDGVGDNSDAFPNDPSETTDTDGDGVGDNGDAFPNDASETTDTDGDGVGDNGDAFPNSNQDATVSVGACDSGVANQLLAGGATFNDIIGAAAIGAKNHGQFVSVVTKLADQWKKAGLITGREHGKITSCAARSK